MGQAPRFSAALDRLARVTGTPRWPEPSGLFVEYRGREVMPRENWCVNRGRMLAPPDMLDYAEPREVA